MSNLKGGIYTIHVEGVGTYYGESQNILKRWAQHRKKLYSGRHHCARLRAAFRAHGMSKFTFKIIAQSPELDKSPALRVALEDMFIKRDPNALNTKGNDTEITPTRMPRKPQYLNAQLLLKRVGRSAWVQVFDKDGKWLGTEPTSEKFRLGTFKTEGYELKRLK